MQNQTAPAIESLHDMIASVAKTLREIVSALVEYPLQVTVAPQARENDTVLLVIVSPGDLGKVIGKQGRTAESLRAVIHAIGTKRGHRFQIDIRSADQVQKSRFEAQSAAITV